MEAIKLAVTWAAARAVSCDMAGTPVTTRLYCCDPYLYDCIAVGAKGPAGKFITWKILDNILKIICYIAPHI